MASPKDGVYATITSVAGKAMPSVTNIGMRPTFGAGKRTKETYILDFNGDLIGQQIEVSFVERLRDEKKFKDENELIDQIKLDVKNTRNILGKYFDSGKT
jgi:riboflavin kinase/FMN adenylyltransferase